MAAIDDLAATHFEVRSRESESSTICRLDTGLFNAGKIAERLLFQVIEPDHNLIDVDSVAATVLSLLSYLATLGPLVDKLDRNACLRRQSSALEMQE